MKKCVHVLILMVVFPVFLMGQSEVDAVRKALKEQKTVAEKVKIYSGFIANVNTTVFNLKEVALAKEGLQFAEKTKQTALAGDILLKLTDFYFYKNEFETSKKFSYQAEALFKARNDKPKLGEALYDLSYIHIGTKEYETAYFYLNQFSDLAYSSKNIDLQGKCLKSFGYYYQEKGAYETALDTFKVALELFTKRKDTGNIFWVSNRLIVTFRSLRRFEEARKIASKGLNLAIQQKDSFNIGYFLLHHSDTYRYAENYDSAASYSLKAIDVYANLKDTLYQDMATYDLAEMYLTTGNLEKSFEYYKKSLALMKGTGNAYNILWSDASVGIIYYEKGEYSKALIRFQAFIERCKKEKDVSNELFFSYWTAKVYIKLKDFQKARFYVQKVIDNWSEDLNYISLRMYVDALLVSSNIYLEQQQYDEAVVEINKALEFAEKRSAFSSFSNIYIAKGALNQEKKNYQAALEDYKKALETANQYGLKKEKLDIHYKIATAYRYLKNYTASIENLKKSLAYAEDIKYTVIFKDIYKGLSDNYADLGNINLAYEYLTESNLYRDSFLVATQNRQIQEIENQFYVKEKEIENELLKSEQAKSKSIIRQRTILGVASILILMLVSIIAIILRRSNYLKTQQNEILEEKVQDRTKELLSANEALEEAKNRRILEEAKSRFFANVSHELRTPLTLIQAPLETSLSSGQLDNKNWTRLTKALQNTEKLNNLINQILDLTKFEANKVQLNEAPEVLYILTRRTIAAFESYTQQKGIQLSLNYEANTSLQIEIDKEKFERILTNYLSNAIKFTPTGGSITIVVKDLMNSLQISVIDTGIGIHNTEIERVFERYYQVTYDKDAPLGQANHHLGGTGIGLSLCRDYAQLFGGKVWAESPAENGKGSVFYFEFPKKEIFGALTTADKLEIEERKQLEQPKPIVQEATVITSVGEKEDTILVVEDNFDLRSFLVELLSEKYEVIAAEHGQEALNILNTIQSTDSRLPSLIISDVMMPIIDGFELLDLLKSSDDYRHIPVIMLTARAEMKDKLKALRIGVDDYMLKPFNGTELEVRIKNLVNSFRNRITTINKLQEEESTDEEADVLEMSKPDVVFLENLENFILKNIDNTKIIADDIASELLMSRAKLFRKIKILTGLTLNQYVNEVRLQKAKTLLELKLVTSVKEVTYSIGFKQTNYFTKIYEERFGKRPSDYL